MMTDALLPDFVPDTDAVDAALNGLASRFPGPGGVAAVVHAGQVIGLRAFGHADPARGLPMSAYTAFPMCSITKQFTCAALLAEFGAPEALDSHIADLLPAFQGARPSARDLCHNQSGLRDYWALTTLAGAHPGQRFTRSDGLALLAGMRRGHFTPGQSYSYANSNFRLLAEAMERASGTSLEELCRRHVWQPAGMTTARMIAETAEHPGTLVGHLGNPALGFIPAENRVFWLGDAGMVATMHDLLAWEMAIDATRHDENSLYAQLSTRQSFADGHTSGYGYGLMHDRLRGLAVIGHTGALPGFRLARFHLGAARLSAVVFFNHEADARGAAFHLLEAALGDTVQHTPRAPDPAPWASSAWLDSERGLALRIVQDGGAQVARYLTGPVAAVASPDGTLRAGPLLLARNTTGAVLQIASENVQVGLTPLEETGFDQGEADALAGHYMCDETGMEMDITTRDGAACARFAGPLGLGPMEPMRALSRDIWQIRTARGLDAPAPGDWTLIVDRDGIGAIRGVRLGCWLARDLSYRRL